MVLCSFGGLNRHVNLGTWVSQQPESTFVDPFWITLPACHAQVLEQRSAQCISSRGLGSVGLSESNPLFDNQKGEVSKISPASRTSHDGGLGGRGEFKTCWVLVVFVAFTDYSTANHSSPLTRIDFYNGRRTSCGQSRWRNGQSIVSASYVSRDIDRRNISFEELGLCP